jgi:hypothetical protein
MVRAPLHEGKTIRLPRRRFKSAVRSSRDRFGEPEQF